MLSLRCGNRTLRKFSITVVLGGLSIVTTGCGSGPAVDFSSGSVAGASSSHAMVGTIFGGPNPIIGATVSLYVTTSGGYGAAVTPSATTTTVGPSGTFQLTLPTGSQVCPPGEFAYVVAVGGNTGGANVNPDAVLMIPIGACSSNYSYSANTNTYNGPSLFINEITTAVSAYTLGRFMTVTDAGVVSIGAPANNHSTSSTTSAAGLSHAFKNALAIINQSTGQPYSFAGNAANASGGATIPTAELYTLGNILQACINTAGTTGTNTATSNDGTGCGKLFSLVTPPQSGAAVPANTMEAMLDLALYPNPEYPRSTYDTWDSTCDTSTGVNAGTTTATTCLYNLAPTQTAYGGGLTAAPPDWSLALVYASGYGSSTSASGCTVMAPCPGLTYPVYVALDYKDDVYILNQDASTATKQNIIAFQYNGTSIFSTPSNTTHITAREIGTDSVGDVFDGDSNSSTGAVLVYGSTGGTPTVITSSSPSLAPDFVIADPFNNLYAASSSSGTNIRKIAYSTNTVTSVGGAATATNGTAAIAFDQNLDIYVLGSTSTSPPVYLLPNTNSVLTSAPTYSSDTSATITGSTGSAFGLVGTGGNNAYAIDTAGITPITKVSSTSITAGSAVTIPARGANPYTPRLMAIDGKGWLYSPDFANAAAVTGVDVYDTVDSLVLGAYEGCFVVGTVSPACSTSTTTAPIYSPHAIAIDSSGDIWVPSASSTTATVTELIGAAYPTWPGLSLAKFGEPQ